MQVFSTFSFFIGDSKRNSLIDFHDATGCYRAISWIFNLQQIAEEQHKESKWQVNQLLDTLVFLVSYLLFLLRNSNDRAERRLENQSNNLLFFENSI